MFNLSTRSVVYDRVTLLNPNNQSYIVREQLFCIVAMMEGIFVRIRSRSLLEGDFID